MSVAELRGLVSIQGADRAAASLGKVEKAGLSAAKGLAGSLGLAGVGGALLATGKVAVNFESQMAEVKVVTGATGKQFKQLGDAAIDLGSKTGRGSGKAAEAIKELAKGGVEAEEILGGGLKGAMDLASAGGMEVAEAAVSMSDALNLFGLKGKSATHVADAFATAANATTADVSDFAQALSQTGGAAKAVGLSFDETVVALESLALAGVKGSDAGTSLKAALSQIANPTKEAAAVMKRLGIDVFDAEGNMKPLSRVAGNLKDSMKGLTREQRLQALQTIAGTDGFRALLALYEQGDSGVRKLADGLRESGSAADVAKAKADTVAGGFDRLKASLESVVTANAGPALDAVGDGMSSIADALDQLREGEVDFGEILGTDATGDINAMVADLKSAGETIGTIFSDVFGSIDIGDYAGRFFGGLLDGWSGAAKTLKSAVQLDIGGVFDGVGQMIQGAFSRTIAAPAGAIVDMLTDPFETAMDKVLGVVSGGLGAIKTFYGALGGIPGLGDLADDAVASIDRGIGAIDKYRESLRDVPKSVKTKIEADADEAKQTLGLLDAIDVEAKIMEIIGSDGDAKSKIEQIKAIPNLPPKITQLLAIDNASAAIAAVQGLLAGIPRAITTTVTTFFNQVGKPFSGGGGGGGSKKGGGGKKGGAASVRARTSANRPYEVAAGLAAVGMAEAEGTADTLDDFRAIEKQRRAIQQRRRAIGKKLRQKIKSEDRARLLDEKAGLQRDLNQLAQKKKDLMSPPETSLSDLAIVTADVQIAMAALTEGTEDDLVALKARQKAIADRIKAIRTKLSKKGLSRDDKVRLNQELAGLLGDSASVAGDIAAATTAPSFTGAQYASAQVAEASLTTDLNDDVTAAQALVGVFQAELAAARATGDPTKIAEAAANLRGASDQLKQAGDAIAQAARAVLEAQITAGDAALVMAQVNTPQDTADDLAAMQAQLVTVTAAYNAAVAAGQNEDIIRFGQLILGLTSSMEDLNASTQEANGLMQQELDLLRQQLEQQSETIGAQGASIRAFEKYVTGIANGGIGSAAASRRGMPRRVARV